MILPLTVFALLLPSAAFAQVVISEIAWPVESAYAADHGLKMGTPTETPQVVINEIAWMGVPVEGVEERQWWRYEWVELYNLTDAAVGLDGWKVGLYREKLDFEIGLYGSIPAQGYFLIGASDRVSGGDMSYANLSGKLANTGQRLVLSDNFGNVVEEIDALGGWFAGDNDTKLTMERRFPDRDANNPENWGSSMKTGGTPGTENSIFGRERFFRLDEESSASFLGITKKESAWSSFLRIVTDKVFIRAFLIALAAAVGVLLLRRYLMLAPR